MRELNVSGIDKLRGGAVPVMVGGIVVGVVGYAGAVIGVCFF